VKEANREVLDQGSLPALLAERARRASDRRLVIDALAGLLAAATVVILRPPMWVPLAALGGCLATFGIWGILDREASETIVGARARRLAQLQAVVAVLGGIAATIFGFSFLFGMIGPLIS
jgi:hypothetical protein